MGIRTPQSGSTTRLPAPSTSHRIPWLVSRSTTLLTASVVSQLTSRSAVPLSLVGLGMAGSIGYGGMEHLWIQLGSGDDAFEVLDTHEQFTILGAGAGDDVIHVRATSGG